MIIGKLGKLCGSSDAIAWGTRLRDLHLKLNHVVVSVTRSRDPFYAIGARAALHLHNSLFKIILVPNFG